MKEKFQVSNVIFFMVEKKNTPKLFPRKIRPINLFCRFSPNMVYMEFVRICFAMHLISTNLIKIYSFRISGAQKRDTKARHMCHKDTYDTKWPS